MLLGAIALLASGLMGCDFAAISVDVEATVEARLELEREIQDQVQATVEALAEAPSSSSATPSSRDASMPSPTATLAQSSTATVTPLPTATPSSRDASMPSPTATLAQSSTATVTPSPTATATQPPRDASMPSPTVTTTPPPTATVTPSPTATATPSPTATAVTSPNTDRVDPNRPDRRHLDLKRYVLRLINDERTASGRGAVQLGENVGAQLHAESMLDNCFASHWGLDGLKPHMRYALAGGYQMSRENVYGLSYCHGDAGSLPPYGDLQAEIERSLGGPIDNRKIWDNIRRDSHETVNVGLAWNRYQVFLVLQFEEDYIKRLQADRINGGYLTLAGGVHNGVIFERDDDLLIEIIFDPPVHGLSVGQLSRTSCYDPGRPVAALRSTPLGGEGHYSDGYTVSYERCSNPYLVQADSRPPESARDARNFRQEAAG